MALLVVVLSARWSRKHRYLPADHLWTHLALVSLQHRRKHAGAPSSSSCPYDLVALPFVSDRNAALTRDAAVDR